MVVNPCAAWDIFILKVHIVHLEFKCNWITCICSGHPSHGEMEERHPAGQTRPRPPGLSVWVRSRAGDRQSTAAVTAVCPPGLMARGCPPPPAGAAPCASHHGLGPHGLSAAFSPGPGLGFRSAASECGRGSEPRGGETHADPRLATQPLVTGPLGSGQGVMVIPGKLPK